MTFFLLLFWLLTPQAAVVEVVYPGVEVRLANTDEWLALPIGAITPLGAGDEIRTDATGRAHIRFGESTGEVILLTESQLTLDNFTDGTIAISMTGVGIHQFNTGDYTFTLDDIEITEAEGIFGTWSFEDAPDSIVVIDGELTTENGERMTNNQGLRSGNDIIELVAPLNAARIESEIDGCEATVNTRDQANLIVRRGPGRGYEALGDVEDGLEVTLVGNTESEFWTRIQFLTGFGWVQSSALQTTCTITKTYPDDIPQERFIAVYNASDRELELLEPFFGSPLLDGYTYRFN